MDSKDSALALDYNGDPLEVMAGRVSVIDMGQPVKAVTLQPDAGNMTVNPDGTLAVVLSDPDIRGTLTARVEIEEGGRTRTVDVDLNAVAGTQQAGWGSGENYMLATDDDGAVVVEPGENHRKIYVSGADTALSLKDIARLEGVNVGDIDGAWFDAHPEYGAGPDKALDPEAGAALWYATNGIGHAPSSDWLLFERGYEYEKEQIGRLSPREAVGESALHPMMIGAWGDGADPVLNTKLWSYQGETMNFVVRDVDVTGGVQLLSGRNWIFDNAEMSQNGFAAQGTQQITLYRSQVVDAILEEPNGSGTWADETTKQQGIFFSSSEGILLDRVLTDHNSWADDYREDGSLEGGMPPNKFNHNVYIQTDVRDVTYRDSVSMQGASFGAQIRPGGLIENVAFIDNNIGLLASGRDNDYSANYTLIRDVVTTLAGHKEVDLQQGAIAHGMTIQGRSASLIDSIVAHLTDPEDTVGLEERTTTNGALTLKEETFADNTIIYNWVTENRRGDYRKDFDQNLPDSIAPETLNQITISEYLEDVLSKDISGDGVPDLSAWLRANWTSLDQAAADIVAFFQNGFGVEKTPERTEAATLSFVPDPRADGVRWDNRLNWDTDKLPGTAEGDSVDLRGNWVNYAGTTELASLDLGPGGRLRVDQGLLSVETLGAGTDGEISLARSGQLWIDGYAGPETLELDMTGGRLANTGNFEGPVALTMSEGEVLFATPGATFTLDGTLTVDGSRSKLGFDGRGDGETRLSLAEGSRIDLTADENGLSRIGEFRSGRWGTEVADIASIIDLGAGYATLALNLAALKGLEGTQTLFEADTLTGGFGMVEISGIDIPGKFGLTLDLAKDALYLDAGLKGGSQAIYAVVGSDARDIFHAADGVRVAVTDYEAEDILNLSSRMAGSDLAELKLVGTLDGQAAIIDGGTEFVRFDAAPDQVTVTVDGLTRVLSLDTSGAPLDPLALPVPAPVENGEFIPEIDPAIGMTPPTITTELGTITVGEWERKRFELSKYFSDPDGDELTYSLENAPDFVSVNGEGRMIVYSEKNETGTAVHEGTHNYTVVASDGASSAEMDVTLTIENRFGPAPDSTTRAGNDTGDSTKDDTTNDLVQDDASSDPTAPDTPVVTTEFGALTIGEWERKRFELSEYFSDPNGDELTYSLKDAPDFVHINGQNRMIVYSEKNESDSALHEGTHSYTVVASDGTSSTEMDVKVTVDNRFGPEPDGGEPETLPSIGDLPAPGAPVVTTEFDEVTVGEQERTRYELSEYFSDFDGDVLTYSLTNAPDFVSINGQGRLILDPSNGDNGGYSFIITASDGENTSAPLEAQVVVRDTDPTPAERNPDVVNAAPEITGTFNTMRMGEHERKRVEMKEIFSDPDGDVLQFTLVGAPDFATLVQGDRLIFNPDQMDAGEYKFGITASDGLEITQTLEAFVVINDTLDISGDWI